MLKTIKKIRLVCVVLVILTITLISNGCGIETYEYTIESAIMYIEEGGFEVHNIRPVLYELIGAEDGVKVDVGPEEITVELYIDGGNINDSFFRYPREGKKAFIVSNLCAYIHSDDEKFYTDLRGVFTH